jgi:chemosensory pili system protein ChpA (sensor histidine kinase/response regulator)
MAAPLAPLSLLVRAGDLLHDLIDATGDRAALGSALVQLHEAFDTTLGTAAADDRPVERARGSGAPAASPAPESRVRRPLRVPLERLERLVGDAGELLVSRAGIEQHLRRLSAQAEEMALAVGRLRRLATRLETEYEVITLGGNLARRLGRDRAGAWRPPDALDFDELELDRYTDFHLISRELTETSSDLAAIGQHVSEAVSELDGRFDGLGRIATTLQDGLMDLRLIPLATLAGRLERTVRRAADEQGKLVDFVLEGGEERLDTGVIDQVADALLHLLRNAVDHAIERPEARVARGRPAHGRIVVSAARHGNQMLVRVEDDGEGLDYARLRARGVEAGHLPAATANDANEGLLQSLMFLPGFSTRDEVSELSGRGIGLDIVQSIVRALDGRIGVDTTPGRGTAFTLRLPLTLAIVRGLLVRAAGRLYAVPQASIREVHRVALADVRAAGRLQLGDHECRPAWLADLLGVSRAEGAEPHAPGGAGEPAVPVLVVEGDDGLAALAVDGFVEMRDLVVKPLPAHVRRVGGVAGASVLGDGQVVLILNPADLLRRHQVAPIQAATASRAPVHRPLHVLIVDDSLSVRRVLAGVVEAAGWRPDQARDGLDALEQLQQMPTPPDVVLLDIEMPRLDGFELTRTLRAQEAYRDLPIVIISSRAGEKHRSRALALGATEYLVKPFQEDALVALVGRLTSNRAAA